MRQNNQLYDVLHVLLHMADLSEPVTSEKLGKIMRTNPVVVRRTLGGLRNKGMVESSKGRTGGWRLACDLTNVTLMDIYQAVGEPTVFAIGRRKLESSCLVEKAVNESLTEALTQAESLLFDRFRDITLDQLAKGFSRDMAAIRRATEVLSA